MGDPFRTDDSSVQLLLSSIFRRGIALSFLLFLWFYLALVPIANIIPISYTMMAERFIYMASAGPVIAIAYGFHHIYQRVSVDRWKEGDCLYSPYWLL